MADPKRGPKDVATSERVGTVAAAQTSAMKHKMKGESKTDQGAQFTTDVVEVERVIERWPKAPRDGARKMIEQYGPPNEATPTKLIWYRNGPWKRTKITSDEIVHNFPMPHVDYLTQWIDYRVPVDKFDDIGAFDGSCLVDRTAGEAAARCDSEAANIVTLNLMHEIVIGKLTVDEARKIYAEQMSAYTMGREAPYVEQLQFDVPDNGTEDRDESMMAGAMAHQMGEKLKDAVGVDSEGVAPTP